MIIYKITIGLTIATILNYSNRDILKDFKEISGYHTAVDLIMYIVIPVQIIIFYNTHNSIIDFTLAKSLWFLITLNYIALIDLHKKVIPNKLILQQLFGLAVIYSLQIITGNIISFSDLTTLFVTLLLTGGSFLIVYILTKGSLGAGDVKMMVALGLSLTQSAAVTAMIYSLMLCTISGILFVILKKKRIKDALPLAPFTLIATIFTFVKFT